MRLTKASEAHVDGPVGMNLRRMTLDSEEMSQIMVARAKNAWRRRIKVRRLKYTCRMKKTSSSSEEDVGDSVKVSLSVSSSEKDEVVLSYGLVSVIGRRREMEDAVRVKLGIMNKKGGGGGGVGGKYDFLGVYDGHCRAVVGGGGGVGRTVGSTAVVAVVGGEELVVANCGDCRAVLFSGGVALALSRDHKRYLYYIPSAREPRRLIGACKAPMILNFDGTILEEATINNFEEESKFRDPNMKLKVRNVSTLLVLWGGASA